MITQLCMRKHTRCCLLQTSTANPYSRGTSPQTVPSSSTKGTRPVWPNFQTNNRVHPHSPQQITDPPHDTEQIKTRIHTCAHRQKYKARATHVMLARASTTSLACAQSPKPLSDAQVVQTQVVDQKRTTGTGMNNPRATRREIWCCLARR